MAATMTPLRLVNLLNDVFQCFDDLVEKHGLEKIKTIGDCYMVAAGVPRERPDHAARSRATCDRHARRGGDRTFGDRKLAFRIGINSGPVVAGVIGRKKFIYDLWGAAVNLASRMESQGRAGPFRSPAAPTTWSRGVRLRNPRRHQGERRRRNGGVACRREEGRSA